MRHGFPCDGVLMGFSVSQVQHTIADRIDLDGIGVHSGEKVSLSLLPADADTGIIFVRTDLPPHQQVDIPALSSAVAATDLCTVLGDPAGAHVKTVEHLMAALLGMGVDNVLVEVDNPEIPVLDGSSEQFVDAINTVGLKAQKRSRRRLRVLKEVHVTMGNSWGTFVPHDCPRYEVEIDFDDAVIGRQSYGIDLTADNFAVEISRARTFGFMKDVESYWAAGFALGSSLENSVVIGEDNAIINPEGLRYENEFVRHKLLDAVGDLALAGAPVVGCFQSYRGGHKLNAMALEALLADPENYEWIGEEAVTAPRAARVELVSMQAPAFGPDKS